MNQEPKTKLSPLEQAYVDQMGPFDRVVLEVAKRQLGMSFDMKRSIGFLEFIKEKEKEKEKASVKC
jgi:hypothetical protein